MSPDILSDLFTLAWKIGVMALCGFVVLAVVVLNIWSMFDSASLKQVDGNLKRGIKISSRPLAAEQLDFLRRFDGNIIEPGRVSWHAPSFIQKRDGQVLIYAGDSRLNRPRRLAYLGYVNLNAPRPALEFRSSLPYHLLLLTLLPILLPLIALAFVINDSVEQKAIQTFLDEKMNFSGDTLP